MKDTIKLIVTCFGIGAGTAAGVGLVEDIRNRVKEKRLKKALNKFSDDLKGFAEELARKEKE